MLFVMLFDFVCCVCVIENVILCFVGDSMCVIMFEIVCEMVVKFDEVL